MTALLLAPVPAWAQGPTCEDAVRTLRVLTGHLSGSRERGELEMAQTVAAQAKAIEALRAELAAVKAAGKELK